MSEVTHKFRARVFEVGDEIGNHVWGGVSLTHDSDPDGSDPLCIPLPLELQQRLATALYKNIEVEVTFRLPGVHSAPSSG